MQGQAERVCGVSIDSEKKKGRIRIESRPLCSVAFGTKAPPNVSVVEGSKNKPGHLTFRAETQQENEMHRFKDLVYYCALAGLSLNATVDVNIHLETTVCMVVVLALLFKR